MDGAQSKNTFKPKQALAPTPQLYDELVGDSMANLAKASLAQIPPIAAGSVVHDIGCGTGASTVAIVDAISGPKAEVTIKGTDINDQALEVYKKCVVDNEWPAEAVKMDAAKLTFEDNTFSLALGNAFLFILPNDGIDAVKEMHRTLKSGGSMIVNSWAYVPNMGALQAASRATRPPGTPDPRAHMEKWAAPEFLQDVIEKGGFEKEKIVLKKAEVYCTTAELTHFATMLWSFIGGTSEVGWIKSDEETWDKAIEVVKQELAKTDGFKALDGGRGQLKFVANIAIATK